MEHNKTRYNAIKLTDYGYDQNRYEALPQDMLPARVTEVHRDRYTLASDEGELFGRLKASAYRDLHAGHEEYPTVGDFVWVRREDDAGAERFIVRTLARHSVFLRQGLQPMEPAQALAANFDYVLILTSLNRDFNIARLERYFAQALQSGGIPVVVLTKADLPGDHAAAVEAARRAARGMDVIALSAHTGEGMEALEAYAQPGKTLVFLGSSGVGKSSLVNALAGENVMRVNAVREDDDRGRHTTVHRALVRLDSGVMVVDTPGMRQLGLWLADEGIADYFDDLDTLARQCRFGDCRHQSEPGCAILEAMAQGEVDEARARRYIRLNRENAHSRRKQSKLLARESRARRR